MPLLVSGSRVDLSVRTIGKNQVRFVIALEVGPSHARGENKIKCNGKLISDYALRDKSTDEEIVEVETLEEEDVDQEDLVEDVILGIQDIKESHTKFLLEKEKMK